MSYQISHGQPVTVWPIKQITDTRGNVQTVPDLDAEPKRTRAHVQPAGAERVNVVGQLDAVLVVMHLDQTVVIDAWSLIEYNGAMWDVIAGPQEHGSVRHTRYIEITCRQRQGDAP